MQCQRESLEKLKQSIYKKAKKADNLPPASNFGLYTILGGRQVCI
jgi:hypothetical protein